MFSLKKHCEVQITKYAKKDLVKIPTYIKEKLLFWIDAVEKFGVKKIREIPGFHDEPLKGDRLGQRSIRLNKAYRAIYVENEHRELVIISIVEVNKHEY